MIRAGPAPSPRAAVTKSRSRSVSTSARTKRLVPNHPVSPIRSTSIASGRCSHRAIAISIKKIRGTASPTSTTRINAVSTQRRTYPATAPTTAPTVTATSMARAPIESDTRDPYTRRLHTSRL